MVNSRADYKFVTGLDKIKVNGEIMPYRVGDHKNDIRGEDIAFCMEAVTEIDHCLGIGGATTSCDMTDTRLLASRPYAIAECLERSRQVTNYLAPTTTAAASIKRGVASSESLSIDWSFNRSFRACFGDIISVPSIKSDKNDFYKGAKVERQPIDNLIEDTQKVRASVNLTYRFNPSGYGHNDLTYNASYFSPEYEEYWRQPFTTTGHVYRYESQKTSGAGAWRSGWRRERANGGTFTANIVGFDDYGLSRTYRVYVALHVAVEVNQNDHYTRHSYIDVLPVAANVSSSGVITVSAADLGAMANGCLSAHGISERYSDGVSQYIAVSFHSLALQYIRGNHTIY